MAVDHDVIVIGSGFGGSVCAFRLAGAGLRVLVLERGRRWTPETYPRRPEDPWLWDATQPGHLHGWFDVRRFTGMTVVQGAGVGGGSLVYANISIEAKPDTFDTGWPSEISYDALAEHYRAAATMLDVQQVPDTQWPERTRLLREAAQKTGYADRFRLLDLAVRFDPDWNYDLPDPHDTRHSKRSSNAQGVPQGTCVHLGNCDIGCDVQAKNTLDLNYLAGAEARGAEIRPLHLVRLVRPSAAGYIVEYDEIVNETLTPGQVTGGIVILAAGSLGSTELLLRSRDAGALPDLSPRLGHGWSSNGDFLTPALHFTRNVSPTRGPTITSAIDLLDGAFKGQDIFVEDGGLPDLGVAALQRVASDDQTDDLLRRVAASAAPLVARLGLLRHIMPWFAQARDAADGVLSLHNGALDLHWDVRASEDTMDAVAAIHRELAERTEGLPLTPVTWTAGRELITPHPLGGCNMGASAATGVVDHRGRVFNYSNLYVADGAVIPKAIGLNPSRTIAAVAERIAAELLADLGR